MIKMNLNESTYREVAKEIENKQDIDTTFRTYTALDTYYGKTYPVYNIYAEYRDVAEEIGIRNYQWVLVGYTDNGVLYLTADEIRDYNLNPYMKGVVITNLEGMIQDNPEAFYIEDDITENLNEDASYDINYVLSMFENFDNMEDLYDIADKYNTSSPVSGNRSTEIEHEQQAIADKFNISLEAAKEVMIRILGFDSQDFNKPNSTTPVTNHDNDYIKIGKAIANYYDEISFDRNGIIVYTDNKRALYNEITNALKSIENIK